jgi:uncharacterized cupredoxin-like copper-binding protein
MKKLLAYGGIILLGIASALVVSAAPNDVIYIGQRAAKVVLNASKRTELRTAAQGVWTGFTPSNVDRIECIKRPEQINDAQGQPTGQAVFKNDCLLHEEVVLSDDDWANLDIAGGAGKGLVDDTKTVKTRSPVTLTPAQEVTWSTVCQNNFGKPLDEVWGFTFYRDTKGDNTRIVGEHLPILSVSPAAYKTARLAGEVIRPLGRVQ